MKKILNEIYSLKESLTASEKKNLFFIGATLFLILFSYPMIRSTTTGFFLDVFGAKKMPLVWLYSVIGLGLIITFLNKLQVRFAIHRLILGLGIFSTLLFFFGAYQMKQGNLWFAYPVYIWKEIYIVIIIHSALAFLNASVSLKVAKVLYGPIGALGSFGGILSLIHI